MLIDDLDSKVGQAEKALEELFNKQDEATEQVTRFQDQINHSEKEIKALRDEIEALTEWSHREKGLPVVKAYGTIFSQTTIKGPHTSGALKNKMQQVCIKETEISDHSSQVKWKMTVSRLR